MILLFQTGHCCLNDEEVRGNESSVAAKYARPAWVRAFELGPVIVPTVALVGLLLLLGKRRP